MANYRISLFMKWIY